MGKLKRSLNADAVGFLYRAANALARGNVETLTFFFQKISAIPFFNESLAKFIRRKSFYTLSKKDRLYWAEMLLDEYKKQISLLKKKL